MVFSTYLLLVAYPSALMVSRYSAGSVMPLRFWYLSSWMKSKYPFTPSSMLLYTRKLSLICVRVPGVYSSMVLRFTLFPVHLVPHFSPK